MKSQLNSIKKQLKKKIHNSLAENEFKNHGEQFQSIEKEREIHSDRLDRQIDRERERERDLDRYTWIDRQIDRQIDRETQIDIGRQIDRESK